MSLFNKINISSIASNTSNILNIIKKGIPVYKEIKPLIKKKNNFNLNSLEEPIKKESNNEYNNSLTFFQ